MILIFALSFLWRALICALALTVCLRSAVADSVLVFNEVMYNPAEGGGDLEWVELYNQMGVDLDISGWSLTGGIYFPFPEGTIVRGFGFVVVAASPAALEAASGYAGAMGPFQGRLDDNGERLDLLNNNLRLLDSLKYQDAGDWPVGPDGSGASLAKLDPDSGSAPAASWASSLQAGGTPGAHNFPAESAGAFPAGLVSYWNFDESSGRALDAAGSNNGTLGTGSARVPGLIGAGAVSFDNTANAYVSVGPGTSNNFAATTGLSIEALVKPLWSGALGDHDEIFRKEDGNNRILFSFQNDGNGNGFSDPPLLPGYGGPVLSFGLNVKGSYRELDMPLDGQAGRPTLAQLEDGRVHHLAAVYDSVSGQKAIYLDGERAYAANLVPGGLISSGGSIAAYLGNVNGRTEPFTGIIDEVAFWNRALTATEISSHLQKSRAGESYFNSPSKAGDRPTLALNEILPSSQGSGWLEIINSGASAAELKDVALKRLGATQGLYLFPEGRLAAGDRLVLTAANLGFELSPGDRLFLYAPDGASLLDAARIENRHLARRPEAAGNWLLPDRPTPGSPNSFALHEDVVINEILYHHRPIPAAPAMVEETVILPIDSTWKFNQSGEDLGTDWRERDYGDSEWASGRALFYLGSGALPAAKNTALTLGPITFYFRTTFEYRDPPEGASLVLRMVIDDGAVIYLNGKEVYRFNVPAGAVNASTLASPSVGAATYGGPFPIPAGSLRQGTNVLAVELHQGTAASNDAAFGLVLASTKLLSEAVPFSESPESWIELYNRGTAEVDLTGWGLEGGIDYRFERGTRLAPGGYLLVTGDRDFLKGLYPGLPIAGNFQGRLSHASDRIVLSDASGNPADSVEYFDGGRWPEYADGGGSSLELRDPHADNSKGEAWAASDETGRSEWKTYSYQGPAAAGVGPVQWRELVLGLLDGGEALLDDLSVIDSPGGTEAELLQNGDFEGGAAHWRFLGNHGLSAVIVDPDDPGNHLLHLVATGATEHMHNHVETTLAPGTNVVNGRTYRVSFRAKWLAGSNQLNTRLYFNRLPRTTLLAVPSLSGTPGARNSRYEGNIGPTYSDLSHLPVAPGTGEAVTVSVRVDDPDGVSAATLRWSVNGAAFSSAAMSSAGQGLFRQEIPAQAASSLVQFYVEAQDALGTVSTCPAGGPASRALYRVRDGQAILGKVHNFRILMTQADVTQMHLETNVMSNHRLGATIVYDERMAFYDAGVRIKGSERGRPVSNRVGYNVSFPPDRLFRGVHEKVHVDRSGGWSLSGSPGQDEILIKHMINKAGGIPGMYDDLIRVIAPRPSETSAALLMMARFDDVYLDSQYQNGSDGTLFKLELIYYPTTTTNGSPEALKRPQPDEVLGTDLQNLGNDKEAYRWTFLIENHLDRDDYSRFIELCKAFSLPVGTLDAGTKDLMDVNEWMRAFAIYSLAGVNDAYTQGNNHNIMFYVQPGDGRVLALPWDMDFSFNRATTAPLWGDQNLSRIIGLPGNQRLFHAHLLDLINKAANPTYMTYWVNHYGALAGQSYATLLNYIGQRRTYVLSRLPPKVPFSITTNGGQDFTVNQEQTAIEGNAWIDVKEILLSGHDALDLTWVSVARWRSTVVLEKGLNVLELLALDQNGNLVGSDSIQVTSAVGPLFIRGDLNLDRSVDISDALTLLFHLFQGQPSTCEDAGDADDDEVLNVTDAVYLLDHLFRGGPSPPAPYPLPGVDPLGTALGCAAGL